MRFRPVRFCTEHGDWCMHLVNLGKIFRLGVRNLFLTFPPSASSLRCVCVAHSVFVGSSCPVSGEAHIGDEVLSHHVSVWSLISQQWWRSTVPEQSRAA